MVPIYFHSKHFKTRFSSDSLVCNPKFMKIQPVGFFLVLPGHWSKDLGEGNIFLNHSAGRHVPNPSHQPPHKYCKYKRIKRLLLWKLTVKSCFGKNEAVALLYCKWFMNVYDFLLYVSVSGCIHAARASFIPTDVACADVETCRNHPGSSSPSWTPFRRWIWGGGKSGWL